MQQFTQTKSQPIPLQLSDVDTDMIIPAQYLTSTERKGYGAHLFERLDIDLHTYKGREILVAKDNFGCGSSREHAVWAIIDYGIKVVIASSLADIFFNNSMKNGLVLVKLPEATIKEILQQEELEVNLETQEVTLPSGEKHPFEFDPFRKDCILKGHDELDYLLENL